jgi:hypothetical protein
VAFSRDGKLLAPVSDNGMVRLWDAATGASPWKPETDFVVRELSFSSDSQYLDTDGAQLSIGPLSPSVISPQSKGMPSGWAAQLYWESMARRGRAELGDTLSRKLACCLSVCVCVLCLVDAKRQSLCPVRG